MTQQQREAVAGILRASPFDPAGDLRDQRPLFEEMIAAAPVPADVVTTPGQLGGVPVIYVDIPGTTTDGVIVYFHGGFFAIGSAAASVGLASDLARQARMQVVTVDYRLAPEHPYPAAPHDAMTAYQGLLDSGQDVARLALAGESAGANLALVTLAAIGRAGRPSRAWSPPASAPTQHRAAFPPAGRHSLDGFGAQTIAHGRVNPDRPDRLIPACRSGRDMRSWPRNRDTRARGGSTPVTRAAIPSEPQRQNTISRTPSPRASGAPTPDNHDLRENTMNTGSAPATIVLVHGGFVDGSGWRPVYHLLKQGGYNVSIVQNPTLSLQGDAAATRLVIDAQHGPVVLVGHSYGGAVITEAGTHPDVAALVFIAAFAPDGNESVNTLLAGFPPDAPQPPILPPRDGFLLLDRDKFHASFAGDLPADLAGFMADSQVPWGTDALGGPVADPAWRARPSWYLVTTEDRMIPPAAQRTMSQRAGSTVVEVAASHSVYLSQPAAVADLIKQAASAVAAYSIDPDNTTA